MDALDELPQRAGLLDARRAYVTQPIQPPASMPIPVCCVPPVTGHVQTSQSSAVADEPAFPRLMFSLHFPVLQAPRAPRLMLEPSAPPARGLPDLEIQMTPTQTQVPSPCAPANADINHPPKPVVTHPLLIHWPLHLNSVLRLR